MRVVILAKDEQINEDGEIIGLKNENEEECEEVLEMVCQRMDLSVCSAGGLTQPQA